MSEVGESAIVADGFDGRVGDSELFGSKIHTQLCHQVRQRFMHGALHRSVHMIYIPFRQIDKAADALFEQGRRGKAPDGVVQPGRYFLIGGEIIVIDQ